MSFEGSANYWQRRNNKKAVERKARAKAKHLGGHSVPRAKEFERTTSDDFSAYPLVVKADYGKYTLSFKGKASLYTSKETDIVVGDRVEVDGDHQIQYRLPRKSFIARIRKDNQRFGGHVETHVLAANIDIGVIVTSVENPPFSASLIDRYLILCSYGGVAPLLCLTKADLLETTPAIIEHYERLGIPVLITSAEKNKGIDDLSKALKGKAAVLLGKSGVGKSSLINALIPGTPLKTGEVSRKSKEGMHTTTSSQMLSWARDSYIIDTPGIRALNLGHIEKDELLQYFPEFIDYTTACRFRDCLHMKEEACGIKDAVEKGIIPAARYETYIKLLNEV